MDNWDPPNAPMAPRDPGLFDAHCSVPSRPAPGRATRDTVTCDVCLAERRKKKMTTPHNLRWGECLKATPPPPEPIEPSPVNEDAPVMPEDEDDKSDRENIEEKMIPSYSDDEDDPSQDVVEPPPTVSAVRQDVSYVSVDKMKLMPHACMTYSDVATAGSYSEMSETDVPD